MKHALAAGLALILGFAGSGFRTGLSRSILGPEAGGT
jgi:hypothetical protein